MESMSRMHLYPNKEPNDTAYIVADRKGLRDLAKKLTQAADSAVGLETITMHGSDGHANTVMIVSHVSADEWQVLPMLKDKNSVPTSMEIVTTYKNLQQQLTQQKSTRRIFLN